MTSTPLRASPPLTVVAPTPADAAANRPADKTTSPPPAAAADKAAQSPAPQTVVKLPAAQKPAAAPATATPPAPTKPAPTSPTAAPQPATAGDSAKKPQSDASLNPTAKTEPAKAPASGAASRPQQGAAITDISKKPAAKEAPTPAPAAKPAVETRLPADPAPAEDAVTPAASPNPTPASTQKRPKLWLLTIALPVILAITYLWWAAWPRYVSEARFVIHSVDGAAENPTGLFAILGGASGPTRQDQLLVRDHILSADMVRQLQERMPLRQMIVADLPDVLWWLPEDSPVEWMVRRLRQVVSVGFDEISGISTVTVQAFKPEDAQRINETILTLATDFVNRISRDNAREGLRFAETETDRALDKVRNARNALNQFQSASQVLDPGAEGGMATAAIAQIEAQIGAARVELASLASFLRQDNPRVQAAQAKIAELTEQLEARRRQLGQADQPSTAELLLQFRSLQAELEFAEANYRAALTGLETARARAAREQKRLVLVVEPGKPEWAAYPTRVFTLLAVLAAAISMHLIISIGMAILREHRVYSRPK